MPLPDYPQLIYRGNFDVTIGKTHKGALLSAEFGGGFREDEVLFPALHTGSLRYNTLHREIEIEVTEGVFKDRLSYIWDFFNDSKAAGNQPFLMKSPLDLKWYLWIFAEDDIEIELLDLYMATAGLKILQTYVRGLSPNADGSFTP